MTRKLVREEKFAIIGKENSIRVLMADERSARNVAFNLSKTLAGSGPYRVARVHVEEMVSETA
jgi:hypothetical protein